MKKMKWTAMVIVLMLAVVLSACGKDEVKPAAVDAKNDKCDVCNMSVMDNQHATQIVMENGKSLKFDDIGCMFNWKNDNDDKKVEKGFVRDYHSKEWIDVEKSNFVFDPSIRTPMAYNVISFEDKKKAEEFVKKNGGNILSYEQLQKHDWKRNEVMIHKMKQEHGHKHENDHEHKEENSDSM